MKILFVLISILILGISGCTPPVQVKPQVINLRCEYLQNPVGMDVAFPRLSWQMRKNTVGARQTAYRIMVATSEEYLAKSKPDMWDSGKIMSDQSIQVCYNGKPLTPGKKVYWKIQIWDESNIESAWSSISFWEMGLLCASEWQAKWIGAPSFLTTGTCKNAAPLFRKELNINKKIRQARAYITGLGYYELYINGKKTGDHVLSPNQTNYDRQKVQKWSESRIGNMTSTVLYETFDITNSLKAGANALGVILGNGWYLQADRPNDTSLWYDTPRLLAQFRIDYEDGTHELLTTNEQWKSSLSPILYNGIHSGEIYDARLEQNGWNEAGFDDSKWVKAEIVRPPEGALKGQISAPDRVTQTILPISIIEADKGVYRFDLGRLFSGWARIRLSGPKGTKIKLRFTEEFGPTYNQTDTYIMKGEGVEIWEPRFTWHAFRYVDVFGSPTKLTVENLEGRVVNTDIVKTGTFECSNALFNKILDNYKWTQLGNVHGGVPSDCPHRERRGYTGDGQISARAAIYNFDMAQFYTKWINDIADGQNHRTGYVPNTTPYQDGGGGTPWGSAYVIIPWYMYNYYGDIRILQTHYEGMKHWIEYMRSQLNKDGILANQGLGEWVPPEIVDIPADFVNSCYYSYCCQLMTKVSDVLGKKTEQKYFTDLNEKAKLAINKVYFNTEKSTYSIGRQGANIYPLGFSIAESSNTGAVFNNLANNVIKDNKVHFDTGILGTPLLLEVLTNMDRADLAYTLMNQRDFPGFGWMIEKGATTIWETFQGDVSHSHPMFGSVCAWFYQHLGGISPDPKFPGFKHIIVKPSPVSSLTFVNCSYDSPYGTIKSDWKFEGDDYLQKLSIPANSSATVYIPGSVGENITEGGCDISRNPGINYLRSEGKYSVFEILAGEYNFVSKGSKRLLKNTILSNPVIHPGDTLVQMHDSVLVSITSDVAGANIRYTLNGMDPDSASTIFEKPFYISKPTTLRARAMLKGYESSFAKSNYIDFINPEYNGLVYKYYDGAWMKIPDFSTLTPTKTGRVYKFSLDDIISTRDEFALTFDGKIQIREEGNYLFYLQSNDGSKLFINNQLIIDHDGPHGADIEKSGMITLTKGTFPIKISYFQAGGGMYLSLKYSGPGIVKQEVPAMILFQK